MNKTQAEAIIFILAIIATMLFTTTLKSCSTNSAVQSIKWDIGRIESDISSIQSNTWSMKLDLDTISFKTRFRVCP